MNRVWPWWKKWKWWKWAATGATAAFAMAMMPVLWPAIPAGHAASRRLVSNADTINGAVIVDPAIVERIERIASSVPAHLLADHRPGAQVRYLAHAFGADDDAAVSYGVFREPAAALAFGCALDDHLKAPCALVEPMAGTAAYADLPGVRCTPMRLALGAPAYEPDRCEPDG